MAADTGDRMQQSQFAERIIHEGKDQLTGDQIEPFPWMLSHVIDEKSFKGLGRSFLVGNDLSEPMCHRLVRFQRNNGRVEPGAAQLHDDLAGPRAVVEHTLRGAEIDTGHELFGEWSDERQNVHLVRIRHLTHDPTVLKMVRPPWEGVLRIRSVRSMVEPGDVVRHAIRGQFLAPGARK